ncbi:MAG: 5-methyltetrahydropteroyltriglutamate--homocysteine S-methyltransferase [Opitutales bacterium]|nr:5-methyltetrahydropteroyltriglutamate--homocysteine S-methyltransferase [Opitutales bacterium]
MTEKLTTHCLGFPRIGANRELKKALESYWAGQIGEDALLASAKELRKRHWLLQKEAGIDLIPSNDFSLYDQMLDTSCILGVVPERIAKEGLNTLDTYFATARGTAKAPACAMTKWFDTNYHYIVPELDRDTRFSLSSNKPVGEFLEALELGIRTTPVIIGPVTYLSLSSCAVEAFERMDLLERLLPVYEKLLRRLKDAGATSVQFDEPIFSCDISAAQKTAISRSYEMLKSAAPCLKLIVCNYFGSMGPSLDLFASLPVHALHIDLTKAPQELLPLVEALRKKDTHLSLGLVDGRNIWRCDTAKAAQAIDKAAAVLGTERIIVATSCSLLHVPVSLTSESELKPDVKARMAFAEEKLLELKALGQNRHDAAKSATASARKAPSPSLRLATIGEADLSRALPRVQRLALQRKSLGLPPIPTTTIGSFPQTKEVRANRAAFKKGDIDSEQYEAFIRSEIEHCIRIQEKAGLDVLVHGEFERNDMVEYFSEQLDGILFTQNGWVQSYGSRCVKPPVIHGEVTRRGPMTLKWTQYAQSLSNSHVKGMLTGPITILKWSFPRNDQPLRTTAFEIALALREEVRDLEDAGTKIIQIDEPGLREGLPLRGSEAAAYLEWAVDAFRLASGGASPQTQIHTHMCYARFDGIIDAVNRLDADVISIEAARSTADRLEAFAADNYGGEVGPGVWDIHSPRVPPVAEMKDKLLEASAIIGTDRLWANPDCGLKTRRWEEVIPALENLVTAAKDARSKLALG